MDKMTKNYLKIIFEFLGETEGYGTQYQYAYLISTLLYNSNIRYTNYLYGIITVEDLELIDDYIMDDDIEGFYHFVKNNYVIDEKELHD